MMANNRVTMDIAMTEHIATCHLCEAICGLVVEVEDQQVVQIRGDRDDPFSQGHICPKAAALGDLHHDPDRLKTPMRREGDQWIDIGWDEAIELVADRLATIRAEHGKDAVGLYVGNPTGHNHGAVLYGLLLGEVLSTKNLFTSNSVDALPRLLTSLLMYGSQALFPIPDLDRTDHLLILGGNPAVSNGSMMTAPGCKRRIAAIRDRGGKVVVVDPRRTETARVADAHHFIRPGTDAMFLMAGVYTLFDEGLVATDRVEAFADTSSLETIRAHTQAFLPERVGPAIGMDSETLRGVFREFAAAKSAVAYGRMGICVQDFGTLSSWLVELVNILTGNLDRPGGAMFTTPAFDLAGIAAALGQSGSFDRWRSRVEGLPEFNGELPCSTLAAEIETPGAGQVRALITHAANPVLSAPNGRRIDAALPGLDFMVAIDIYLNETTRHADVILPPAFGLESDHFPLLFAAMGVRNTVKYTPAAVAPAPEAKQAWEILLALSRRMMAKSGVPGKAAAALAGKLLDRGPTALVGAAVRFGPHGKKVFGDGLTLETLRANPHGIDLGALVPRLPKALRTADKRVDLAPSRVLADLPRLRERLVSEPEAGLALIGRRRLSCNNSWMHNSNRLVKGRDPCTLLIHPDDAAERGIVDGADVEVTSTAGEVIVAAKVSDEVMPGVVSLPHGWGHGRRGTRLSVANAHPGVSANDLTDDQRLDAVSGAVSLNGVRVEVRTT